MLRVIADGTEADEDGNISFRKEALKLDSIPIAIAVQEQRR